MDGIRLFGALSGLTFAVMLLAAGAMFFYGQPTEQGQALLNAIASLFPLSLAICIFVPSSQPVTARAAAAFMLAGIAWAYFDPEVHSTATKRERDEAAANPLNKFKERREARAPAFYAVFAVILVVVLIYGGIPGGGAVMGMFEGNPAPPSGAEPPPDAAGYPPYSGQPQYPQPPQYPGYGPSPQYPGYGPSPQYPGYPPGYAPPGYPPYPQYPGYPPGAYPNYPGYPPPSSPQPSSPPPQAQPPSTPQPPRPLSIHDRTDFVDPK